MVLRLQDLELALKIAVLWRGRRTLTDTRAGASSSASPYYMMFIGRRERRTSRNGPITGVCAGTKDCDARPPISAQRGRGVTTDVPCYKNMNSVWTHQLAVTSVPIFPFGPLLMKPNI